MSSILILALAIIQLPQFFVLSIEVKKHTLPSIVTVITILTSYIGIILNRIIAIKIK
ncbi:hypothetical protein MHTCC0001_33280 [Flavobacteriaceae bacterium MHTCC 0001]